jgi:hypothetical protein
MVLNNFYGNYSMSKFLYFSCFLLVFSLMLGLVLYCVYVEMEWLYGNPEQGDSEVLATWTSVRVSFTAPFLLFVCMICFNFVIACWLYCFNVDVFVCFFVFVFIFGEKLLRAYVFCLYYMPNWNKVLLTYLQITKTQVLSLEAENVFGRLISRRLEDPRLISLRLGLRRNFLLCSQLSGGAE